MEVRRSPISTKAALAERRAAAEARAKDHIEILRHSAAVLRHQHVADVLERILLSGGRIRFDILADILMAQPWAVDVSGAVLGHLLTVDEAVFDSVADECWVDVLPLSEVFDRHWVDLEQRSAWVSLYADALRDFANREELRDRAVSQQAELTRALAKPD